MKMFWRLSVIALFSLVGTVYADDSAMRQEVEDLRAKVAALENLQMALSAGGDAATLTSMKKKAAIKIGGKVDVLTMVIHRDEDPTNGNGEDDVVDSTQFRGEAALYFDIAANKNSGLKIKLDLEDFWDEDPDQDDLLEECYYYWKKIRGSAFNLAFGKKEVKFGQDKSIGYMDGFVHGSAYLLKGNEEEAATTEYQNANLHDTVGTNSFVKEWDNTFVIESCYAYKDLLKLYATLFQSNSSTGGGRVTRGMHEDRSDDSLFFQSWALKLELMPVEGLTFEMSFINEHNDSNGDADQHGNAAEAAQQAFSFGFDYKMKNAPVEIFGEYLHGWDWRFDNNLDTDTAQIGIKWGVTETVDLSLMGEWAQIDRDNAGAGAYADEDYYNLYMTAYYKFDSGMKVGLEYAHQWFDGDVKGGGNLDADADMVGFVCKWGF